MSTVNMLQAKAHLSRLVEALETGAETEIIIARNGRPAARLVPIDRQVARLRIGVARGQFTPPAPDDALDDAVAELMRGGARCICAGRGVQRDDRARLMPPLARPVSLGRGPA